MKHQKFTQNYLFKPSTNDTFKIKTVILLMIEIFFSYLPVWVRPCKDSVTGVGSTNTEIYFILLL